MEEKEEKQLLEKIEKAAEKGARKAGFKSSLLSSIPTILIILIIAILIVPKVTSLNNIFNSIFKTDENVEGRDYTINNHGIFGYSAADFEAAILGDATKLKKLEVYKQEVSDVATLTETGLFNWSALTKSQVITYYGDVVYTVDLSKLTSNDIDFDPEKKVIIMHIDHPEQGEINIPEDRMKYADPEKGLLAFGDIKVTAEQLYEVQNEVRTKMQQQLDNSNVKETADRFAKLSVWETYSPIVKGVSSSYSLEVKFKD